MPPMYHAYKFKQVEVEPASKKESLLTNIVFVFLIILFLALDGIFAVDWSGTNGKKVTTHTDRGEMFIRAPSSTKP
ncbi:MAG: hypothetical protein PHS95_00235 [Candidatus Pacebacteria bacterium]|nr:hypothetical protein [Candidatus Paceibacterota bacterium]